jgi:hypothetical protein
MAPSQSIEERVVVKLISVFKVTAVYSKQLHQCKTLSARKIMTG